MYAAAIAWQKGGEAWIRQLDITPTLIKIFVVLLLASPGLYPLSLMRSHDFANDLSWLVRLTDSPDEKSLEMLPPKEKVDSAIKTIQDEASAAKEYGEVLFMDQRQLLTFGYITGVPFVPQYEKKILMNQALSSDAAYFKGFYADLAAHRFSLLITEPLRTPIKDSSFQFGEENNAWVKWVANPILCYYEEKDLLNAVSVQLLIPKNQPVDCSTQLP
jgi:hypothetical protein